MSCSEPGVLEGGEPNILSSLQQRDLLLNTKLFVPPLRPNRVSRPRLFEWMNRGLDKALILISAPAGYGKTTLVSSWLHEIEIPSTWISLDEGDNDPVCFFEYFLAALQKNIPTIRLDWLGMLQGMKPSPYTSLMTLLINEVNERAGPNVLVLDDFHLITSYPVLSALSFLIEHAPPQLHLVLLSRADPLLPLSRLRARGQLLEIRADQLRFSPEEVSAFLNETMGLNLSPPDLASMEARTEGWIAGLQLAALSMQAYGDAHSFVSAFTGSHVYIMDYLVDEVLKLETESVCSFLLYTSILSHMCGSLCDAVVEAAGFKPGDGQAMLENLAQRNLFVIPLDGERRWYRYHQLFADCLNRRLEQLFPQQLPDLHRRAAQWSEQNGLMDDAIQHTLKAGDAKHAVRLVDQNGCHLLIRGEVTNLLSWIEAVEPYSQTYPWIGIQKGWALALSGQLDRVEATLQAAEVLITDRIAVDDRGTLLGAAAAARAYRANMLGETARAADFARQALQFLPVSNDLACSLRSAATSILGDASWMTGDLAQAKRAYTEAVKIGQAAGDVYMVIICNANLADILREQGQLQRAAKIYSTMIEAARLPDGQISALAERVYAGLSRVSYERNDLEAAEAYANRCIELSRRWGSIDFEAYGCLILARLHHAKRCPEKALEAMLAVERLVGENDLSPWRSIRLKPTLASLWITLGNLERAASFIEESAISIDSIRKTSLPDQGEIAHQHDLEYIVLLHLLTARGDYDDALLLSQHLLPKAEAANRVGRLIEILVLQALAFQGKKDGESALRAMERGLSIAQPEGYTRVFLDKGEPVAKLLYQIKSQRLGSGYESELLAEFGQASGAQLPPAQILVEPLTLRELEVLQLISDGLSNSEIAAKLVISIPTVKRHISNIYTKLGVESRTQAIARGRELKLFAEPESHTRR